MMKRILTFLLSLNTLALSQILEIHQINVSQGDACYIQINTPDTIRFLIDAGNSTKGNNVITPYLNSTGVSTYALNFTIASHYHADHIGGLDEVINQFNPTYCYDRGESYNSQQFSQYLNSAGARRRTLNAKDTIFAIQDSLRKITLTCLASNGRIWSRYEGTTDENTLSIALLLEFATTQDTFRFFTAGDLYAKQESLIAVYFPIKINLMKISHHGSYTSTSPLMLKTFQPQAVMIPVGNNNPYGHPHAETIQKLDTTQSIKFIYQTETGARTGTKSIVAGNIIVKVYDKFYTITTSNFPTRTDTFYFTNENPLNTENSPFEKDPNQKQGQKLMRLETYALDGNFLIDIFAPQEMIQTVQVYNILGQLVHENQTLSYEKFTLKIPTSASGVYMVLIKTDKNLYHEKITLVK
jgi:beta-lactamase superfamily II metal-dependent hydrolase